MHIATLLVYLALGLLVGTLLPSLLTWLVMLWAG
jgi:hypothetical protein